MRNYYLSYLLLLIFITTACSRKQFTPEEADRSMKVLNSNLINILTAGSEKPEYQALAFLLNLENSPLPFHKSTNSTSPDTSKYSFEKNKGIYLWDVETKAFKKSKDANIISLHLPTGTSGANDLWLDLNKYENQAYSSRPNLPVQIDAAIRSEKNQFATIKHTANITNNLPENISTLIKGLDYEAGFELKRTQIKNEGKLNLELFLKVKNFEVISANVDAQVEYSRNSYFFKTIDFYLKLQDHHVIGKINYGEINPTAADYIDSFNSNSSIILFEGNHQVGKIILNKTDNKELLDYFVRFSDGKETLLSTYIPALKKLLNLKY